MAEEKTAHESSSEESQESHEHEETSSSHESDDAEAAAPRRRKANRRIRRYEVPIDAGAGGDSQTILRIKPLGFWKMFFAVMLGFFSALLLFLVTSVLAVILLGNVLWNTMETRVGNWVTDIATRVSDELDTADQSVQNIANTVDQTVNNIVGNDNTSSTTTAASGTAK